MPVNFKPEQYETFEFSMKPYVIVFILVGRSYLKKLNLKDKMKQVLLK